MRQRLYSFSFTEVAVTAQQDLFQMEAITVPLQLVAVFLSQSSDLGDASSEGLSILIRRVTDDVTDTATEYPVDGGDSAALAHLNVNQTSELTTGINVIHSEVWNVAQGPFIYMPPPEMRPTAKVTDAIVVNLNTTPADSLTISGTCYFAEYGN